MNRLWRARIRAYIHRALWALFWWGIVSTMVLFYPAPESPEGLNKVHYLFFVPLFFAFLFTVHIATGHIRRSVLVGFGITTLAFLQLYRLVTPISTVLILITVLSLEYWFHGRSGGFQSTH